MANNRSEIRSAIVALLLGNTDADSNVYPNRETKLFQSELPAILIYTLHEPSILESQNGMRYIRTLQLAVKIRVQSSETIDDDLDALTAEVETIIANNPSLNGTVLSTIQTLTEVLVDSTGEEDLATATLTFECKYIA
jgi:hypothetical protein